jgi:hypothetical protein
MKRTNKLIVGVACALATGLGYPPAAFNAAAQDERFVSRDEYQKLQREHEQLKQELQNIKAMLQGGSLKQTAPSAPAAATTEQAEVEKSSGDALSLSRYVFPGSTRFLLSGYGAAGFSALRHNDAAFEAQFNPLLLWKLSDRLLFEGEVEFELEDDETETKLEQAHLSYLLNDYMTFDAGKFLNPMNAFVERYHMAWVNRLPDKPLAVYDGLLPETYVGAQLRGGVPVGPTRLNYAAFVANAPKLVTSIGPDDELESLGTLDFDNFGNDGGHIATGGHIGFQPIPELEIGYGVHYSGLADSDEEGFFHSVDLNYVRDSEILRGLIRLSGQWVWSRIGKGTYDADGTPLVFDNDRDGGYAQISYRPTKVGNNFLRQFEGVFRYDRFNQDDTPIGYDESRYTFGLNYWILPKTVFKVAYQIDDKSSDEPDEGGVLVQFATGF